MGVPSDGSYGVPEGSDQRFPLHVRERRVVDREGPRLDEFSRGKIDASVAELTDERDTVKGQGSDLANTIGRGPRRLT